MQIKEIDLSNIHLDGGCGQFIGKSISNDGILTLRTCKITEPGFEALNAELGDKQVIKT